MAPLSFLKSGSSSHSGDRGGGISRESISRPRALSNNGLDTPGYTFSSSFSDLPIFALERPSTPPQPHAVPGASSLARSASTSGTGGSSSNNVHGSPGRYNPARLLRRKASRRGEPDAWGGVTGHPAPPITTGPTLLPPGAAPPSIHHFPIPSGAGADAAPPSISQPIWGARGSSPTEASSISSDATEARRARGHVPRAHSGGGISIPGGGNVSKFGSTRSARSTRSIHSDGENEHAFVQPGGSQLPPRGPLASAFDPPTSSSVAATPMSSSHPFLAQIGNSTPSTTPGTSTSPSQDTVDPSWGSWSRTTPLSPPRRIGRPNPPPRMHAQGSHGSAVSTSSRASRGSIESATQYNSRPTSPSSHHSGGSDGQLGPGIAKDTAEWLARKPSSRRRVPIASAFSSASPFAMANGNMNGADGGGGGERISRVSSNYSDRTDGSDPTESMVDLETSEATETMDDGPQTEPIISPPTRQSFGPAAFGHMGLTDIHHAYYRRTSEGTNRSVSNNSTRGLATPRRESAPSQTTPTPPVSSDTPRKSSLSARGEGYEVSMSYMPGVDEVRWEVVLRRVNGRTHLVPPGPLTLEGPSDPQLNRGRIHAHAPPLASSVNLSLALDVEHPMGRLVFSSEPDANSTPTRVRGSRTLASQLPARTTSLGSTAPTLAAAAELGPAFSSPSRDGSMAINTPPGTLSPVAESVSSVFSPISPTTPATPVTPAIATPTAAGMSGASPLSPSAVKRFGMMDGAPASATTTAPPPPPPRRDSRRERGLSATPSPSHTPGDSGMSTPNGPTSPAIGHEHVSPTTTPPPTSLTSPARPAPPRPSRPSRPPSMASDGGNGGSNGGNHTGLNSIRTTIHAPIASINNGHGAPTDARRTLGPSAFGLERLRDADHVEQMEHIMTPDSAKSSFAEFNVESAH